MATRPAAEGSWVGGFELDRRWVLLHLHILSATAPATVTVDLPLDGIADQAPTTVHVAAGQLEVAMEHAGNSLQFTGRITARTITGVVQYGSQRSRFRLERTMALPAAVDAYIGTYQLAPDRTVFIGHLLGSSHLVCYTFESATIAALYPTAEHAFFVGSGLFQPLPRMAELAFTRNEQQTITGLGWQVPGQPVVVAPKVPLRAEEVRFASGDVELAGTLLLPPAPGRYPAIVLIHGSGAQTRAMVRLYGDSFARHGIAALVYDKRGVGESRGDWTSASFDDLAADALAGVELLRRHPEIRADHVGLWGASQGGWIAPMAAARAPDVAFVVLLAAPAVTIAEQNVQSVAHALRANGLAEDDIQAAAAHIALWNHVICTGREWDQLQASVARAKGTAWAAYAWSLERVPSAEDARLARAELERDPVPILERVHCPVLALFGAVDTVVPPQENVARMAAAFERSGNPDVTIEVIPEAEHLLLHAETGSSAEFRRTTRWKPEHVGLIMAWLRERFDGALEA